MFRVVSLNRRGLAGFLLGLALLTLTVVAVAGAAPSASPRISAHLTETVFTGSQTGSVKLVYKFSKPSERFSYRLTLRQGSKWRLVRSATSRKKKGYFRGSKATSLKKLFAGKPARVGSYRLKLSAGTGGRRLDFKVVKARPYVSRISAGNEHTCVVLSGGRVKCWGSNDHGQLGDGTKTNRPTSVAVRGISGATQLSASNDFTCAVLSNGNVKCWGLNDHGQLGDGTARDSSTPVATAGISKAIGVSTGTDYACALFSSGRVKCWGTGIYGGSVGSTPVEIPGISTAVQISDGGGADTCALLAGGTIRCWHSYLLGALFDVEGLSHVTQISFYCALLSDGTVKCWGSGSPKQISGIANAVQLSGGCAVISDGSIKCSSYQPDGGLHTTQVSGISNAVQVSAGGGHGCALLVGGAVKCWGSSLNGRLGADWKPFRTTPVAVRGIENGAEIRGGSYFTCAALDSGGVDCWGGNYHGELGNGTSGDANSSLIPLPVTGISSATRVGTGFGHACALLSNGSVRCWGYNYDGQLGNGSSLSDAVASPVPVSGVSNATDVSAGAFHSCALLSDGTIKCWGAGYNGQLGNGALSNSSTPVAVSGISDAIQLSAGAYDTCAVLSVGAIKCWGGNSGGELGNGTTTNSSIPITVSGISNATQVSASDQEFSNEMSHTCAVLSNHALRCWGDNHDGELGNGEGDYSPTPVSVIGIP